LGCLLSEQRKFEPAIEHLEKAARLRKRDSVIRVALATVLLEVGRAAEAVEHLEVAIELRPANAAAWVRLDQALGALEGAPTPQRDAAWLEKFAAAGPEILDHEVARQRLARLACDLRQFDRAAEFLSGKTFHPYELSHDLRDLWAEIYRRKAIELAMAGQFGLARESISLALQYPPNLGLGRPHRRFDAPNLYAAGCILEAAGDADGAKQYFEQAAEEEQPDPTPAKPWSVLAQIRLGRKEQAMARLADLVRQTQACLEAEFHIHLAGQFQQILSLCRQIAEGYLPALPDLARMTEANHGQ
jgi:tetratricopeptide (TPR) repeat protein